MEEERDEKVGKRQMGRIEKGGGEDEGERGEVIKGRE